MADIALIDPLGRAVRLPDATWYGHIVRNHREMSPLRMGAEAAVREPVEIRFSASDTNCRLYYGAGPRAGLMICIVADVVAGFVKTAYLAKRIKPGAQEWPLQNPSKEASGPSGSITT